MQVAAGGNGAPRSRPGANVLRVIRDPAASRAPRAPLARPPRAALRAPPGHCDLRALHRPSPTPATPRHPATPRRLSDPPRHAQPLKQLHRLAGMVGQGIERAGGHPQIVDRHLASLEREATHPPHRRPLVAFGVAAPEHEADPQRVVEPHGRQLPGRGDDERLVAGLERPAEAGVGVAVARHRTYVRIQLGRTPLANRRRLPERAARTTLDKQHLAQAESHVMHSHLRRGVGCGGRGKRRA